MRGLDLIVKIRERMIKPPRTYAIGDIHGCRKQLDILLSKIRADTEARQVFNQADDFLLPRLIFLGDYIDRGPDSRGVIDRLMQGVEGFSTVSLIGNHERMMLDALDDERNNYEAWKIWLQNGGDETLRSFGLPPGDNYRQERDTFNAVLGQKRLRWLRQLPFYLEEDGYLFVHAGIKPATPLADQLEKDLLWIRNRFLSSDLDHGFVVVHGHTPCETPEVRPNRINVDTGAVYGRTLTSVVLESGEQPRFLSVGYGE